MATLLTFAAVCFAWVFFRAPDLATAWPIIAGMLGQHGIALPDALVTRLGPLAPLLQSAGVEVYLGGGGRFVEAWAWIAAAAVISFCLPNTQELMRRHAPALDFVAGHSSPSLWQGRWQPTPRWALMIALLAAASLMALNRPSEFLYFQF